MTFQVAFSIWWGVQTQVILVNQRRGARPHRQISQIWRAFMTRGVSGFDFGAHDKVLWDQNLDKWTFSRTSKFWGNEHFPQFPEIPKTTSHSGVWQMVYAPAGLVRFHNNQISMISTECVEVNNTQENVIELLGLFLISSYFCPQKRVVWILAWAPLKEP